MSTDLLAAYAVPSSALDGVLLSLPKAAAVTFKVRLPSRHNRAYQAAAQVALAKTATLDAKGEVTVDTGKLGTLADDRLEAFVLHCIDHDSLPAGVTVEALLGSHRPAAEALFARALELANAEEGDADAAVGKSLDSSAGRVNGMAVKPSTRGSNKQDGSHPHTAVPT